jgi:hypothetical protein
MGCAVCGPWDLEGDPGRCRVSPTGVKGMRRARNIGWLTVALPAAMVLVVGCQPVGGTILFPPTILSASVTTLAGSLTVDQAASVTLSATVVDPSGTITSVIADLSQIGGNGAVPLTLSTVADTWSTTAVVLPAVSGTGQVVVTASSSTNLTAQATATINVASTGGNISPVLTEPMVIGTLLTNTDSSIDVSVVVTDVDGTVQSVVADLSQIGGLAGEPLFPSGQDPTLWTFSGLVNPPTSGTLTVAFLATDNMGGGWGRQAPQWWSIR